MCHLILALPFVALPMLWLLPWEVGVPAYAVVAALAVAVYWMAFKAMRLPVTTGDGALLNAVGTVRSVDRRSARIWVLGELWSATARGMALYVGDTVEGDRSRRIDAQGSQAGEHHRTGVDTAAKIVGCTWFLQTLRLM